MEGGGGRVSWSPSSSQLIFLELSSLRCLGSLVFPLSEVIAFEKSLKPLCVNVHWAQVEEVWGGRGSAPSILSPIERRGRPASWEEPRFWSQTDMCSATSS